MRDVDRSAGWPAAEERRAGPLQHFDALHAVERMRQAVDLLAIGETVLVNPRVETADQKPVEAADRIRSAGARAAHVAQRVLDVRTPPAA